LGAIVPDVQLTVQDVVAEGDLAVTCYTITGTVTGSFMGSKPSGKAFSARAMTPFPLVDGKIVEADPIWNQDRMQLFGIQIPQPGQK
jgi:predicted ester cyclase